MDFLHERFILLGSGDDCCALCRRGREETIIESDIVLVRVDDSDVERYEDRAGDLLQCRSW